ncbi:MAG: type II toxin-antitoxin system YafQ family toxin [Endomicrobium sp.]|jgi:mRNA interferase YafQ|nr:type II toxin-antitoxin system YafQ family toxin [Endomicrobium sp.]
MYKLSTTKRFDKDLKALIKRGYDIKLLNTVVALLVAGKKLPQRNKDHALQGEWQGCRECHITSD